MSTKNSFIFESNGQRSKSRVTKTVPAWVFALLWVLDSSIVLQWQYRLSQIWITVFVFGHLVRLLVRPPILCLHLLSALSWRWLLFDLAVDGLMNQLLQLQYNFRPHLPRVSYCNGREFLARNHDVTRRWICYRQHDGHPSTPATDRKWTIGHVTLPLRRALEIRMSSARRRCALNASRDLIWRHPAATRCIGCIFT